MVHHWSEAPMNDPQHSTACSRSVGTGKALQHPHADTALPQESKLGALTAAKQMMMMMCGGKSQQSPPGQKQIWLSICKCERKSSSSRNCTCFKEKEKTKTSNKSRVESGVSSMRQTWTKNQEQEYKNTIWHPSYRSRSDNRMNLKHFHLFFILAFKKNRHIFTKRIHLPYNILGLK